MINVLIADDHLLVRQGMRAFLEQDGEIKVVGEASDGDKTLVMIKDLNPDIALIDISMPRLNGLITTQRIRDLNVKTRVIIVSMYSENTLVQQVIQNGAKGYLLKSSAMEELIQAIKIIHGGKVYFSPEIMEILVSNFINGEKSSGQGVFNILTPRELEILQLVTDGETSAGIAAKMNIGVKTVEKHRSAIMSKLNIHSTAGLVKFAIKKGLILTDP